LTPLGQGSGAIVFENAALVEMTAQVKLNVDGGVSGGEFL